MKFAELVLHPERGKRLYLYNNKERYKNLYCGNKGILISAIYQYEKGDWCVKYKPTYTDPIITVYSNDLNFGGISVKGHVGTWYSVDQKVFSLNGKNTILLLLEHETYGDEAPCIIIDLKGNLILEDVWNGFDDLVEYLEN